MHREASTKPSSCLTIAYTTQGNNYAYLASFPTEVVIVSSIIIQCGRPVATDEPAGRGVVAIGEGLVKGIGKKSLVAREQNAALKARVSAFATHIPTITTVLVDRQEQSAPVGLNQRYRRADTTKMGSS
jgi:hypothetical protein